MKSLNQATQIVQRLVDSGHVAYFAGGWVRDFVLECPSSDIDIATSATPEEVMALFSHTVPVGIAFGVVIVVEEGHPFEVASFRKEGRYLDGRKPESVEPATPEEDAERRDFTINGMFYDPLTKQVFDFVGGKRDLEAKVVRAIGDPHERFREDRLRMIRGVRFAARFGYALDFETEQAMKAHAPTLLPAVSMERIWQELERMAAFPRFDWALVTMQRLGLLSAIFPVLMDVTTEEVEQRVESFSRFPKKTPTLLHLVQLFPNQTAEQLSDMCDFLRVSNQERKEIEWYQRVKKMTQQKGDPAGWARLYANPMSALVFEVVAAEMGELAGEKFLGEHRQEQERLKGHIERIQAKRPLVSAEHLLKEGIAPGVRLGELLREAEQIAVNEDLHESEKVLLCLKASDKWPQI